MTALHSARETEPRVQIEISIPQPQRAIVLEELLWTLDGVESVTYRYYPDEAREETLAGLSVIGMSPDLANRIKNLIASEGFSEEATVGAIQTVTESDWAESWKQYWHVNRILPNVIIQPSWEEYTSLPGETVIRLDPGSAFGTGTHETTQLVLFAMQEVFQADPNIHSVLDVGTGSGILAIYAALQGVTRNIGTDNDPVAVAVSHENAELNAVEKHITFSTETVPEVSAEPFQLVVANILAPVLREMMPDLKQAMTQNHNKGSWLILSGITRGQVPDMRKSLAENRLKLVRLLQKGEWMALVCRNV